MRSQQTPWSSAIDRGELTGTSENKTHLLFDFRESESEMLLMCLSVLYNIMMKGYSSDIYHKCICIHLYL